MFVLVPERTDGLRRPSGSSSSSSAVLRDLQYDVDGAVGDADPIAAVRKLLETRAFDEIILATLPAGASRWLRMDLAHRLQRVTKLPVEEVAGEEPDAAEEARLAELQFPGVPAAGTGPAGPRAPRRGRRRATPSSPAWRCRAARRRARSTRSATVLRRSNGSAAPGGPAGVDLVLVDLKMPVVDGFELLERLRAEHDLEKLAVVVLTTSSRLEDRERAHAPRCPRLRDEGGVLPALP